MREPREEQIKKNPRSLQSEHEIEGKKKKFPAFLRPPSSHAKFISHNTSIRNGYEKNWNIMLYTAYQTK